MKVRATSTSPTLTRVPAAVAEPCRVCTTPDRCDREGECRWSEDGSTSFVGVYISETQCQQREAGLREDLAASRRRERVLQVLLVLAAVAAAVAVLA